MAERTSALAGHFLPIARQAWGTGVSLSEVSDLTLWQVAAWPETLAEISQVIENQIGASEAPGPGRCASGTRGAALRIEPLKWWLLDARSIRRRGFGSYSRPISFADPDPNCGLRCCRVFKSPSAVRSSGSRI